MAVPSDLRKRLSLFLLLSALLVVVFLFLDPSARTLSVLSSRLIAPSSLAPPTTPRQQNPTPTPTPGNTPYSQPHASAAVDAKPGESTDASAKAEESASRPDDIAGAAGDSGNSELPRVDESSDADGAEGKARTGTADGEGVVDGDGGDEAAAEVRWETCRVGRGVSAADYIPCLDNVKAIKKLRSRRQMEHRERHCPAPPPRCLVRLPRGYRPPVPWPRSRDMIWYNNVPHPKLVEYKKDQNWVTKSDDYFVFPGGGTQFKAGVTRYIQFIEQDEHEAQIQFALERGIPAFLAVIGTQKLPFPDEAFDVVHCARCRVHWYAPLDTCVFSTDVSSSNEKISWPIPWPERLNVKYLSMPDDSASTKKKFDADTKYWKEVISEIYFNDFPVNWSSVRNVMDMNAGYGGFAAALIDKPLWVMNVVPVGQTDTLPVIFSRGLIGVYHDWCESFNTYPRTYDLLHMSYLLGSLTDRCGIIEVAAEIDRMLRPDRWFVLKDSEMILKKMRPLLKSLHYETVVVGQQFLVAKKSFWRPDK
ncbi:hypothetical protein ABZP36_028305 [Zizania latifolia]